MLNFVLMLTYNILWALCLPFLFLRDYRKDRQQGLQGYSLERLGFWGKLPEWSVWIHSVSLGETKVAVQWVQALKERGPYVILCTTHTQSGRMTLEKAFNGHPQIAIKYLPYDFYPIVRCLLSRTKVKAIVLVETEIWPNWMIQWHRKKRKIFVLNGRISDRTYPRYLKGPKLLRSLFEKISWVAAQSPQDAERFTALGAKEVTVTGNCKWDLVFPANTEEQSRNFQGCWGPRPVFMAASTHAGEEVMVIEVFKKLQLLIPNLLLLLVPRHPQRFGEVGTLLEQAGLDYSRRSQFPHKVLETTGVVLGDSINEMGAYYASATVAFIGGSLVQVGGHNPIEPAYFGLPIVIGPYYYNFQAIVETFVEQKALAIVQDPQGLYEQLAYLLQSQDRSMGYAARSLLAQHQGATQAAVDMIAPIL